MDQRVDNRTVRDANKLTSVGFIGQVEHTHEVLSLVKLLLRSFLDNEREGLTGAFFYDGINFGEILEGSVWSVERHLQLTREDVKFKKIQIIGKKVIFKRYYSTWRMHAKDGNVVRMLYPELVGIIDEFNADKSVLETTYQAFQIAHLKRAYRASSIPLHALQH